jgi:hypothetical protein
LAEILSKIATNSINPPLRIGELICQKNPNELASLKKYGNMYSTAITISVKAADKPPSYRSTISSRSHLAVATISAICKLCAVPVIVRKNTTSIPDSIDVLVDK